MACKFFIVETNCTSVSTAGSDYETTTLMLPFEPSGDGQTVCGNVPIIDDDLGNEPNELFSVTITSVSDGSIAIGQESETCVTIEDNDSKSYSHLFNSVNE